MAPLAHLPDALPAPSPERLRNHAPSLRLRPRLRREPSRTRQPRHHPRALRHARLRRPTPAPPHPPRPIPARRPPVQRTRRPSPAHDRLSARGADGPERARASALRRGRQPLHVRRRGVPDRRVWVDDCAGGAVRQVEAEGCRTEFRVRAAVARVCRVVEAVMRGALFPGCVFFFGLVWWGFEGWMFPLFATERQAW